MNIVPLLPLNRHCFFFVFREHNDLPCSFLVRFLQKDSSFVSRDAENYVKLLVSQSEIPETTLRWLQNGATDEEKRSLTLVLSCISTLVLDLRSVIYQNIPFIIHRNDFPGKLCTQFFTISGMRVHNRRTADFATLISPNGSLEVRKLFFRWLQNRLIVGLAAGF